MTLDSTGPERRPCSRITSAKSAASAERIARWPGERRIEGEQQFFEARLGQLALERGLPCRMLEHAVFRLFRIQKQELSRRSGGLDVEAHFFLSMSLSEA